MGQFEELIIPLIVNAREAMPASGSVCIRACNLSNTDSDIKSDREAAAKDFVHIQVIDTGVGISSEALKSYLSIHSSRPKVPVVASRSLKHAPLSKRSAEK